MKKYINLKSHDVLNKKFLTELSGYSAKEVDLYLDQILADYVTYEELVKTQVGIINERTQLAQDQKAEIQKLNIELQNLQEQISKTSKYTNASLAEEIKEIRKENADIKKRMKG